MEYLTKKYPDAEIISKIYDEMVELHQKTDEGLSKGDSKYRPLTVLLGVLYKLQLRNDKFFRQCGQQIGTAEKEPLLHTLAYFWHLQHSLGKNIRVNVHNVETIQDTQKLMEKNRQSTAASLGLGEDCLPVVWVSDLGPSNIEDHCPDHVISVHHDASLVVLTILGTRIFPRPNAQDIIMDCACKTMEFHDGEAHSGMAIGARNLLKQSGGELTGILQQNDSYNLIIIGYSLGAGIAQLVTMELNGGAVSIPVNTKIRTVVFGCPPVYTTQATIPQMPNVLVVQNHNDGICGTSMKTINDVFLKTRAIDRLNLKRRTLFRMALTRSTGEEPDSPDDLTLPSVSSEASEEDQPEQIEMALDADGISDCESDITPVNEQPQKTSEEKASFLSLSGMRETLSNFMRSPSQEKWKQVEEAVENIPMGSQPRLYQVSKSILVLKRMKDGISTRVFTNLEETSKFSEKIRFKPSMFDHHMPWSYNALFKDFGENDAPDLTALDAFMADPVDPNPSTNHSTLYPNLSQL